MSLWLMVAYTLPVGRSVVAWGGWVGQTFQLFLVWGGLVWVGERTWDGWRGRGAWGWFGLGRGFASRDASAVAVAELTATWYW